jgi:hypothetical protein
MKATLSLLLASTCNFDLSWLDGLPAADDSKLHDGCIPMYFCQPTSGDCRGIALVPCAPWTSQQAADSTSYRPDILTWKGGWNQWWDEFGSQRERSGERWGEEGNL